MAKTRREFTPEFKREAVALLESRGRPQMQVAAELGIQPSMLRQWRATLNGAPPRPRPAGSTGALPSSPIASPSDQAAEIARLRRELDRTRMERDVLKNVWPAPSARWSMKVPVSGLHKRIRHVGTGPPPRWRAARPGPHKHVGLNEPLFLPGFRNAARPSGHLHCPPADLMDPRRSLAFRSGSTSRDVSGVSRLQLSLEAHALPQRRPGDPGELGGERDDHGVVVRPRQQASQPSTGCVFCLGH